MTQRLPAVLLLLCTSVSAFGQLAVKRAPGEIRIDAVLDEQAWLDATPLAIDREWFPGDNIDAAVKTDVFVTWDANYLYVGFRAFDPQPSRIRARFAERDGALLDDTVGFLVDPFNDDRIAYQFRINPLGVQGDAINSDVEGTEDFSWDAIWESAGRLTPDGFVVEVAVPLQQLRIPAGAAEQTWGFMAMRDYPRDVRHRFRSVVTDENRNCLICQFADISGFAVTSVGRNIEVTPTLTAKDDSGVDAGVSGRWAITPGTSLQATINPDFSHVEADAAQLDVNTRFALSFPEKRPFFLEGSDFFETQMPLLFTRTIAEPEAGLKFTGKSGGASYGVLLARDEITNLLVPSDQSSFLTTLGRPSTTAVARYRHGFGADTSAGLFASSRTARGYSNTVVSADSFHRFTEQDTVRLQVAGSRSTGSLEGHALLASYDHNDRDWFWAASYGETAPQFRADSGLVNQVGIRTGEAEGYRRIRGGPDRWFTNLYLELSADTTTEWSGDWSEWGSDIAVTYQGRRQSNVSILVAPNQEYFDGTTYHNMRYSIDGSFQPSRDVTLGLFVNWGEAIDFNDSRAAEFLTVTPYATLHIGRRFSSEVSWVRQTFRTPDGDHIFTADLPQTRMLYHFNARTFVRAILQYRNVDRGASESSGLLSQLLFSYRLDAQTVFLAGYSDNYAGSESVDLTQTDRAVFVKLSYAWLF
jgi:hypothetical protein